MRIAHVITRMVVGGAQENTLYNCRDLAEQYGDEVLLLTGPSSGPEGALLEQAQAAFPVVVIPELGRAIHPWRDGQAYRVLCRQLREFRPDVVHTHSAKGGILGRLAAAAVGVSVIVHTVHGAPFGPYEPWWRSKFYQLCEWYAAKKCHALISVADAMTELLVQARIAPREKFTTIYSGMEVEPFLRSAALRNEVRQRLGYRPEEIVVAKIARLFSLKGHGDLIAAAAAAVKENSQLRFLLIGDGILRTEIEKEIADRGLAAFFQFTGLVPPADIPGYLSACDMLVHTSLREGLPRTLPQALLAGKPVVAYDVDGAREVALPNRTGFLLPAGDIEGLAAAILTLARQPQLRDDFGAKGKELCRERFRHETMTAQIRELYLQLLRERENGANS